MILILIKIIHIFENSIKFRSSVYLNYLMITRRLYNLFKIKLNRITTKSFSYDIFLYGTELKRRQKHKKITKID